MQPEGTSFVCFGQDTNRYLVNHLPLIGFNLGRLPLDGTPPAIRCFTVDVNEAGNPNVELKIYPNPSIGIFTVENFEATQSHLVYDINGRALKISIVNGQLNLSNDPNGIYLLKVQSKEGNSISKKIIKY